MFSQSSSAYRTENPDQGKSPAELTGSLAEANGFDLSYLLENSRGELAPGQLSLLYSPLFISLIFMLVPAGFLGYQLYSQGFIKQLTTLNLPLGEVISAMPQGLLIMGGILLLITVLGLYFFIITTLDFLGRSVQVLEGVGVGKVTTSTDDDGSKTTNLYYVVAGQRFKVTRKAFEVFEWGRKYRVYFTPQRKVLVNIEVVE
ncbi:MAG: hypothetical protein WBB64_00050 [Anaerolineales bacterium]